MFICKKFSNSLFKHLMRLLLVAKKEFLLTKLDKKEFFNDKICDYVFIVSVCL